MFGWLKKQKKVDPQVGEKYNFYSESPFEPRPMATIEILAVRDGWVQYQYISGDGRLFSMKISSFHSVGFEKVG